MKKYCWLIICFFALSATAQEKLVIMGSPPDMYVVHVVGEGESLQDISNQFGQSVTKLSSYNGINSNIVFSKGAQIRIPLTQYNLIRVRGDENSAPVYHIMLKGENLFRLSKANGISMAALRQLNNFKADSVKDGQAVIVGYMVNARTPAQKKQAALKDIDATENNKTIPITPLSEKYTGKKEPVTPLSKVSSTAAPEAKMGVSKVLISEPKKKVEPADYIPKEGDEGYFAVPYTQHPESLSLQFHSGDAATFKTISGWTDRKYYVLINDVAPETVVRITAPNNKSICAKVLGPLQETKGGSGLLLRMSNSAAATLGIADAKFTVTVTYFE